MAGYYKIGKLVAAHGLTGELVLKHELGKKNALKGVTTIFIADKKDGFLPWFVEGTVAKTADEIYLKLETINDRETARKLTQKEVWLPEEDFKKSAASSSPAMLLGYTIIDNGNPLSEILEVIEQPHQLLCRLEINGKEVLIPLHQESLTQINHKKKQVMVELPEGLLDIYLG